MLLLTKKIAIILSLLILATTVGCQNIETRTDEWKQERIATMYQKYAQKFSQVEDITPSKLQQLQQQETKLVLVDVREPEEIAVSQIPGAITAEEFENNLQQYQDSMVVAYCTIGYRSGLYAQELQQQGIKVFNLAGSLLAWSHADGELVNAEGVTNQVHVFGRKWQLIAKNYQPVW